MVATSALRIVMSMGAWYSCSMVTLFLNKSLLTSMAVPVHYLAIGQMCTTCLLGAIKVYGGCDGAAARKGAGLAANVDGRTAMSSNAFHRNIFIVGLLRGSTVVLGLVALENIAASFTEAIKSSAPLFTVLFAWLILRERTSWRVMLSLVPVMVGLVLTSGTEISFELIGFAAAMATNCIDCVQNVFSKKLMKSLTPVQLQFYTSAAAVTIQLPLMVYMQWDHLAAAWNGENGAIVPWTAFALFIACVFYHLQSVAAYYCVDSVAPVTMSVANTLKRGMLIVLSIIYFGNEVFVSTYFGMATILSGIGLYTYVRTVESRAAAALDVGKYEVVSKVSGSPLPSRRAAGFQSSDEDDDIELAERR